MADKIAEALAHINPAALSYQQWLSVGMALKQEGFSPDAFDAWSAQDTARYHAGECHRKWKGFGGSAHPVTGASILKLAMETGWQPPRGEANGNEKPPPRLENTWTARPLQTYLETLFRTDDIVGYVTGSVERNGRYYPERGRYDRTAGALIAALDACGGDIGAALGAYNPRAGAWIRFNPLDGNGIKDDNVTAYRYALVEADEGGIDAQVALIRTLRLPVACLVSSGGKSAHAVVRVDAKSLKEYRERVDTLYRICRERGLMADTQNRNPSRLSRMPGAVRGGVPQRLLAVNLGESSFEKWLAWISPPQDGLPEPESMAEAWTHIPDPAPELIQGLLRQGHKMLVSGPSKAGKSYLLIALCCAIAEGREWLSLPCAKGRVLYVNLELERASCLRRFQEVYAALGWPVNGLGNLDIWHLRGKALPMGKLADALERKAKAGQYAAIVIDPIYKVLTGDENSAEHMAQFCNHIDRVARSLSAAVIYCHHHSKGYQGQKRSMDRASGSGVFARDADALLDMIALDTEDRHTARTAWRIECVLREFAQPQPIQVWFSHPLHTLDRDNALTNALPQGETPAWQRAVQRNTSHVRAAKRMRMHAFEEAVASAGDNPLTKRELADMLCLSERTVTDRIRESGRYRVDRNTGYVLPIPEE